MEKIFSIQNLKRLFIFLFVAAFVIVFCRSAGSASIPAVVMAAIVGLIGAYFYDCRVVTKQDGMTKILLITGALFVICVVLKLNDSNMVMYSSYIPNNIASVNPTVIGTPRGIRSDEWGVGISETFYMIYQPCFNIQNFFDAVVWGIQPTNWGYIFLPMDMAFSWSYLLPYFGLFLALLFFFRIFIKDTLTVPVLLSIITMFSPEIMWWDSQIKYMQFFLIIDFFYYFFECKSIKLKIFCSIGLLINISSIIVRVYPAWHIPLAYLGVFIVIGIYWYEKKINLNKYDAIYISATILGICLVALCYYLGEKENIELIANTVYPGRRQVNGGAISGSYFGHYLTSVLTPFKSTPFLNDSEVSSFISLFPLPFLIYLIRIDYLKKFHVLNMLVAFSCLSFVYMTIGFFPIISKITLFSYSVEPRMYTIFGLAQLLLLLLEVYYLSQIGEECRSISWKMVLGFICYCMFFYFIYMKQRQIVDYLGIFLFLFETFGLSLLSIVALKGKMKPFVISLLCITAISGFTVSPITVGTDIITQTPLAKQIRLIESEDSGNWITLEDTWKSKYLKAQGVECLNALSYPPRLDLFEPLDPQYQYSDVYNRYAHVGITLSDADTIFSLVFPDCFFITMNRNDLAKWNVKYIMTTQNLSIDTENLYSELIYTDTLDGNFIYKIHYK